MPEKPEQSPDQQPPQAEQADGFDEQQAVSFQVFLEEFPVNTLQKVSGYHTDTKDAYNPISKNAPQLRLYCSNQACKGFRRFDGRWGVRDVPKGKEPKPDFLVYRCRDCGVQEKIFCIWSIACDEKGNGAAMKIGEVPELHIDLPPALPKLLGGDYPVFIKGLKCEKQGFGIGAFSYYRRVVENQKGRFFSQIAKVAARLQAEERIVAGLEAAATETQFAKAVDDAKDFIPASLLVDGHNPMKLIHKALSIGLHAKDDETCLQTAHSIRVVLQDLSRRITETLREESELKRALSNLLQFHEEKG